MILVESAPWLASASRVRVDIQRRQPHEIIVAGAMAGEIGDAIPCEIRSRAASSEIKIRAERRGERQSRAQLTKLCQLAPGHPRLQCRRGGGELCHLRTRCERRPRVAKCRTQSVERGDDLVERGLLGSAFQRAKNQRLDGKPFTLRAVDYGLQPRRTRCGKPLRKAIVLCARARDEGDGACQQNQRGNSKRFQCSTTVRTDVGLPKSSGTAAAWASARHWS